MARRASPAALLALALAATILNAQIGGVESNVPEAGFGPPPAAAPAPSTPGGVPLPGATPTIHVYSRETILDVLVTDDKGQPVRGLSRSDFTILEDNHPLPIRGFSENSTFAPPPPPIPPLNTYTNATNLPTNGPVQIILLDLIGTPPGMMQRAKPYIADYLRAMPQGTEVAVFEFSPNKATSLLHGFTSDRNLAANAVNNLDDEWIQRPLGRDDPFRFAMAGMNRIAAYVAGIHGRKNLIWVVPGMPLMVMRDGGLSWIVGSPDMTKVHQLMDLYDLFTREQIAIYPFGPGGIHLANPVAQAVADQTGGTTSNSNDYQASLTTIVDASSHFYTLSYIPPRPEEDGHFHPITIKVDRPHVHLTYRTGYNDEQPNPPNTMLTQDMIQGPMRLGALPATQLIFTLEVTPAPPDATGPKVEISDKHHTGSAKDHPYTAVFSVDPTQIAFSESPDGKRTAKLEFDLGVFDSFSQLGPVRSQVITLNVNPSGYDDFMRKPFHFTLPIPIPPGQQTLRAGLFDTVSGKAGTLEVPLTIHKER